MEDVLRWSLLVLGSCIIIGVLVHGIWVSRKNSEAKSAKSNGEQDLEQELQPQGWHSNDNINDPTLDELSNSDDDLNNHDDLDHGFSADRKDPILQPSEFDDLGLGAVRVVSSTKTDNTEQKASAKNTDEQTSSDSQNKDSDLENASSQTTTGDTAGQTRTADQKSDAPQEKEQTSKIYASVVTQPKPEFANKYQSLAAETVAISKEEKVHSAATKTARHTDESLNVSKVSNTDLNSTRSSSGVNDGYQAPEPPPFLLKKEQSTPIVEKPQSSDTTQSDTTQVAPKRKAEESKLESAVKESLTEQAFNLVKRKKTENTRKRREPKIAEDQMRIDFDEQPQEQTKTSAKVEEKPAVKQEVLVLNVKVPDDSTIAGAALLPMLLTLGFKFGEQDIFHRHVNSNGKGPVLFSLANMFKPGVFDIDNLENFTTQGVSLFMILPIEGDPHQVFNMMHNAARKIADEFSAQVYDGRRTLLTKQSLQQYVEKIREFERQRMLSR